MTTGFDYRLPPLIPPLVARFIDNVELVTETIARFGSPLNVVFPDVFSDNVERFEALLEDRGVRHRLCYAHKGNRAHAFALAAHRAGIGIDVASAGELDSAVSAGFATDRIETTGPKGEAFLRRLIGTGVVINVDNLWELQRLAEIIAEHPGITVPVLVRLSGFAPAVAGESPSRFGIDVAEVDSILSVLTAAADRIELRGLAFHLDGSDVGARVGAVSGCLEVMSRAYAQGIRPRILDIGGGFRQRFVADSAPFVRYANALSAGLGGDGPTLGLPGEHFGIASFRKYGNDVDGVEQLAELLDTPLPRFGGHTVAEALRESMVELWLEPGKALLDHAGMTIAGVEFVKRLADGSVMVNLDISRDTVTLTDQEVMIDPLVIYRRPAEEYTTGCDGVFFGGRLCRERDMVTRRKVFLDLIPLPGDRVVFVNTAAYRMDFSAAPALMHPLPTKVVAVEKASERGSFTVEADDSTRSR